MKAEAKTIGGASKITVMAYTRDPHKQEQTE